MQKVECFVCTCLCFCVFIGMTFSRALHCNIDSVVIILQLEHQVSFYDVLMTNTGWFHRCDSANRKRVMQIHTHAYKYPSAFFSKCLGWKIACRNEKNIIFLSLS